MSNVPLQELRRVADSLAQLRGKTVVDAVMRSDLRQLRIELADGQLVVLTLDADELGRARLEVDIVRAPETATRQLEVRFDAL
ncbi:MAG TPA: hypothetical protein VLA95_04995 [Gemmatimonadales bacterium]|nr:hypothetical protein [Gemmatimonadales bacterium]